MIFGVLGKIRTEHLPTTRLDRCGYIDMFSRDDILRERHIAVSQNKPVIRIVKNNNDGFDVFSQW
jgi:hypothetical protein